MNVTLGYGADNKAEQELNKACPKQLFGLSDLASSLFDNHDQHKFFVASASEVRLITNPPEKFWKTNAHLVTVFMPPRMIASAIKEHCSSNQVASGSSFWINPPWSANFAKDLLPKIHPTALNGCRIRGIILASIAAINGPAEQLILEVPKGRMDDILRVTSGCTIVGDSDSGILKILPLTTIEFTHEEEDGAKVGKLQQSALSDNNSDSASTKGLQIPACPVCIHRIDPFRFGLPRPRVQHLCSKFCPSPGSILEETCHKQNLLKKWELPARCKPCQVIDHYWDYSNRKHGEDSELFCEQCSMHKTLWTCLTCGFVGCGRYSNKHSVAHFEQTGHPFSLELATLRIWDYCQGEDGGFIQRADLLECPSSPPLLYPVFYPWLTRERDLDGHNQSVPSLGGAPYNNLNNSLYDGTTNSGFSKATEKSSKKVMMIGEEYEALLQSALEDQAQHYEDEITRLRASYTDSLVDKHSLIPEEAKEIEDLQTENRVTRENIRKASIELIEAQAREAELREVSGKLLSEQKESNELLKRIDEEHRIQNEKGRIQIEDLELQIADLEANLRMMQQFSQNNELANAQIFGTTTAPDSRTSGGKKGKRKGRFSRK